MHLGVDLVFDEAAELSKKWLPESILLNMVCAQTLLRSPDRLLGVEYVHALVFGEDALEHLHWIRHALIQGLQILWVALVRCRWEGRQRRSD